MRRLFFILIIVIHAQPAKSQLDWIDLNQSILYSFNDLDFASESVGYMVGINGKILKTVDGGFNWSLQNSTVTGDLYDVEFYDEQTGWVCGEGGIVLRTTNGGDTWTPKIILPADEFHAVDFFSSTSGYVAGVNTTTNTGEIYYTTDGGANFTGIAVPGSVAGVTDIVFFDLFSGYILYEDQLLYTTNQGFTWVPVTLPTADVMHRIEMTDFQYGYIVGDEGTILTTSTGTSWNAQASGTSSHLRGLCILDADTIFISGDTEILATHNGGTTWTSYTFASIFTSIDASNSETAWTGGDFGRFTRTAVDTDIAVTGFEGNTSQCSNMPFDVIVNVTNESYAPATGGHFQVLKNGLPVLEYDWTGNILYGNSEQINLGLEFITETSLFTINFTGDDIATNNTFSFTITVNGGTDYGVNGPVEICAGQSVELMATGGTSYYWYNATTDSTAQSQVVSPATTTSYVVEITQPACTILDTALVIVGNGNCNTNAFSPNGDGTNDFFFIDNLPGAQNTVVIFNRWGDPLLTLQNYDNETIFWNGNDSAGKNLPEGVYFYKVAAASAAPFSEGWVQVVR